METGLHEQKLLLSAREAAGLLGIDTGSVYRAAQRRELPHVRVGNRVLFPRRELEAWIADQARASVAQEPPRLGKVG